MNKEIHFEGDEDWVYDSKAKFENIFNKKKGKLLEAGCGVGNYVVLFSKLGFNVTGIEISKSRAEIARKNCKKYKVNAKIIEGDIRSLPFKDNSFDLVFSHGVVEHFQDTSQALDELYRVLNINGEAMISVPNRYTFYTLAKLLQKLIDKVFNTHLWKGGYERSFPISSFKKLLESSGFKITKIKRYEPSPGKKYPFIGKILKILDKPIYLSGIGGHFIHFFCKKE